MKKKPSIPAKQIINLGNGNVLFMVGYFNSDEKNKKRDYDIVQMNVYEKKEIKTLPLQSNLCKMMPSEAVYWGFKYNPNLDVISIVIRDQELYSKSRVEKMFVLIASLKDGAVLWQHEFDFVHEALFNQQGNLIAIFERPRSSDGYVHILNVIRKEWICQVHLEYGGLPFGWDGFTWSDESLVFIAPHKIAILSPDEIEKIEKKKARKYCK